MEVDMYEGTALAEHFEDAGREKAVGEIAKKVEKARKDAEKVLQKYRWEDVEKIFKGPAQRGALAKALHCTYLLGFVAGLREVEEMLKKI